MREARQRELSTSVPFRSGRTTRSKSAFDISGRNRQKMKQKEEKCFTMKGSIDYWVTSHFSL